MLSPLFFGFAIVHSGEGFWRTVKRWCWALLLLAAALFMVRLIKFDLVAPDYLKAIESNLWIFAVFGFGYKYLNKQSNVLDYLSQAAYPVYIVHMIFLYLGSLLLVPLEIPAFLKLTLIVIITFTGSIVLYELLVRRTHFLRTLFGLKNSQAWKQALRRAKRYYRENQCDEKYPLSNTIGCFPDN